MSGKIEISRELAECDHAWIDDGMHTLACTKCGKTESNELAPCPLCGAEAESHGYADSDQLFVQCTDCGCSVEVGSGRFEVWNERAAPVVERQPVHMVRSHGSCFWEEISGESLEMCQCQPEEYEIRTLYAEQPAPVAVVLPDGYMIVERSIWTEEQAESAAKCITMLKNVPGMNDRDLALAAMDAGQCKAPDIQLADFACLDKVKELNQ